MVFRHKPTHGLDTAQVKEMNGAWYHARKIGRPLNRLVTVRPIDIDDLAPQARCRAFAVWRNKIGSFARSRGYAFSGIWSREVNKDGSGEHLHPLTHVPPKHQADFDDIVIGWFPGAGETDIAPATQHTRIKRDGKRMSAIGYILKQMTPQAWWKRGLIRSKNGGVIMGKRGGVTKDLDRHAQGTYRAPEIEERQPYDRVRSDGTLSRGGHCGRGRPAVMGRRKATRSRAAQDKSARRDLTSVTAARRLSSHANPTATPRTTSPSPTQTEVTAR